MKPVTFPEDELTHNLITEWWYWNGNLWDSRKRRYSYMNCLFKVNPKKVKLPFMKGIPFGTYFFSHSMVTDVEKKKAFPEIEYMSLVSKDSFQKPLLFINYTNPVTTVGYFNNVMEEAKRGIYYCKTDRMELNLVAQKKPLRVGGKGYVHLVNRRASYYYSFTNLKTKGRIRIGNRWIQVTGKSWMDHQWANMPYEKNKWTWFSLQLNNNTEILCYEYGEGKKLKHLASIMFSDGKTAHSTNVQIISVGRSWKSPKTQAEYPLDWQIIIPGQNIDLQVRALVPRQEQLFGTINYWEGPLDITGHLNGKKVTGSGFAELVGYPSEFDNIKFFRATFEEIVHKGFDYLRHRK